MSTIKSKEDAGYTIADDDLMPLVDNAGVTGKSVTINQISKRLRSTKHVTIGSNGDYPDLTTAFPIERAKSRYDTVYSAGQVTLTDGGYKVIPIGGASFTGVERGSFYIRIVALDLFIPLIVIAPLAEDRTRSNNYAILKYKWDNGTGDYDYEIIRPLYSHFEIMAGHVIEPISDSNGLVVPNFCSIAGINKMSSIWNGSLDLKPNEAGISIQNLSWGNNEGTNQLNTTPFSTIERAMIRIKGDYASFNANYHADIHVDNIISGLNNSERDGILFALPSNTPGTKHNGIGSVIIRNSDVYSYWDTIVAGAERYVIQNNNFFMRSFQDYTDPSCLVMWRNYDSSKPDSIAVQFQNNTMDLFNDNQDDSIVSAILMPDNFNHSSNRSPNMSGVVSGNEFRARVATIATIQQATFMRMGSFWDNPGNTRIISNNNLHDTRQLDETYLNHNYDGALVSGVCPVEVGAGDVNSDGSAIVKVGNFVTNDNLEWV